MAELNTNGATSLQLRLNEPTTNAALNRLLDRVETLEKAVSRLADLLEQAPGMAAMVGDMADEQLRQAKGRGVEIDQRLKTALALAERLTAPEMVAKINQLLDLADQAPQAVAMVGDMVDGTLRQVTMRGVDIDQRLRTALALAERLTAPEMVANINQLLDLADQAPQAMAMIGDMVDGTFRQAAMRGVDIDQRLKLALEMAEKLTDPGRVAQINQLLELADQAPAVLAMMGDMADGMAARLELQARLDAGLSIADKATRPETLRKLGEMFDVLLEAESGMLSPEAVRTLGKTANALVISQQQPAQPIGMFGLLRAMGDPDIQRAMGFLLTFGRQFGKSLTSGK